VVSEVDLMAGNGSYRGIPQFNQGNTALNNEIENRVVEIEFSEAGSRL
jgi:hypothetical protein